MRWVTLNLPFPEEGTGTVSPVHGKLQEVKSETLLYLCSVKNMQAKLSWAGWQKCFLNLLEIKVQHLGSPSWIYPILCHPCAGSWKSALGSPREGTGEFSALWRRHWGCWTTGLHSSPCCFPVQHNDLHTDPLHTGIDLKAEFVSVSNCSAVEGLSSCCSPSWPVA